MSLVELLVVLALIAILAIISIPSLSGAVSKSALEKQTDFLAGIIMTCRVRAMEKQCQSLMDFYPQDGTYTAFFDKNSNGSRDSDEECLGPYRLENGIKYGFNGTTGPNSTGVPEDGVSFVNNRLVFNMQGSSTAGTIYLIKGERASALRLLPASGTVICWIYDGKWRKR